MTKTLVSSILVSILFYSRAQAQLNPAYFFKEYPYLNESEIYDIDRNIWKLMALKRTWAKFSTSIGEVAIYKRAKVASPKQKNKQIKTLWFSKDGHEYLLTLNSKRLSVVSISRVKNSLSFSLIYQGSYCKLWLPRAEKRKHRNHYRLKYDYWIFFNVPNAPYFEIYPMIQGSGKSEVFAFFENSGGFFFDWQLHDYEYAPFEQRFRVYLNWKNALWETKTLHHCHWNDLPDKDFGTHLTLFRFRNQWGLYRWVSPIVKREDDAHSLIFFLKPIGKERN